MFKRIKKEIYIEGMHCEGCVKRVKNALLSIPVIKECDVSLEDKKATLVLSKNVDEKVILDKIESLGFQIK